MPEIQLQERPAVSFTEAIREATEAALSADPRVHVLGLGATYRNGLDGTMGDLAARFPDRVHDTPVSEAAIMGMSVGMAASGLRPVVHHGRIEFSLLGADALLTQAASWNFMFGGDYSCPLTVRIALGRQWGNGPQHTRIGRGIFAAPGLKVVCPSSPVMAKALLLAAIEDPNPVLFMEHRWLYKTRQTVPEGTLGIGLDEAQVLRLGRDVTLVAVGDMVLEALRAARILEDLGVSAEVIDVVSIYPLDPQPILDSVRKTRRLVVADIAPPGFSITEQVLALVAEFGHSHAAMASVNAPSAPCPTAPSLTEAYYPNEFSIVRAALGLIGDGPLLRFSRTTETAKTFEQLHMAPTENFDDLRVAEPLPAV